MENIGNYVNLSKLFAANQKMNAYNNYQKNAKNGERVEDALFNSADINGDGKITSADKTAAQKEINTLSNCKSTPNLYDVTGDGKIDMTDLINFSTEIDLDGDGEVSQAEIDFLETQQQQLLNRVQKMYTFLNRPGIMSTSKKLDINGDGKIDLNDYKDFLSLTERRNLEDSTDKTDKYLNSIKKQLESRTLDITQNGKITVADIAYAEQYIEVAKEKVKGGTKYDHLLESLLSNSDMNGDKEVDEKDVEMLEFALAQLKSKLAMENTDEIKTNYEKTQNQVTAANKNVATTKTIVSTTKKEADTAKSNYNKALKAKQVAQTQYNNATKSLEKYKAEQTRLNNLLQQKLAAGKAENSKEIISIKRQLVKYNAYVTQYEAKVTTTKSALERAEEKTNTEKTNYDAKHTAYTTAQNDYKQAQTDLKQAQTDLKQAQTDLKQAQQEYSKFQQYNTTSDKLKNTYNTNMQMNLQKAIEQIKPLRTSSIVK